jgi:hypothetical protein
MQHKQLPLELVIDDKFMRQVFIYEYSQNTYQGPKSFSYEGGRSVVRYTQYYKILSNDERLVDAKAIIKYAAGNILSHDAQTKGSIKFEMTSSKYHRVCNLCLFLPSVLSFGTLNLIGYPFEGKSMELNFAATVFGRDGNFIARYDRTGQNTGWVAFYYGYDRKDALSAAVAGAVSNAITLLITDIQKDSDTILSKLNN